MRYFHICSFFLILFNKIIRNGTRIITNFSIFLEMDFRFELSSSGARQLVWKGYVYHKNTSTGRCTYWRCAHAARLKCKATVVTEYGVMVRVKNPYHNHLPMKRLLYGMGKNQKRNLKNQNLFNSYRRVE